MVEVQTDQRTQHLKGCRILVVEDDFFLADDLASALEDHGAEVIGPASTYQDGLLMMVAGGRIDVALLDINLRGEMAYPLADILLDRGVDVMLATGYDRSALPERFYPVVRIEKPFDAAVLARALPKLMRRGRYPSS
jgi:DNA-binding NarL/FixJ family response regulator